MLLLTAVLLSLAGVIAMVNGTIMAAEVTIAVQVGGGDYGEANIKAYVKPFEKETGIKVVQVRDWTELSKLKLWVESGNVETSVISIPGGYYYPAVKNGWLEKIDYSLFSEKQTANMDEISKQSHGVGQLFYSQVLAYYTDKFPSDKPRPANWADFWDVEKFPGKRTLMWGGWGEGGLWEQALMADGVPMDKLYPIDIERAIRSLNKIRPHIVKWWKEGAEVQQMFADRFVDLGMAYDGRIGNLKKKKLPVEIEWNQGHLQLDYWAIPKGAPNIKAAQKFIAFATLAKQQAEFCKLIPYGPTNKGAFNYLTAEYAKQIPTHPDNFKKQFIQNNKWYSEVGPDGKTNVEKMIERWNKWMLE